MEILKILTGEESIAGLEINGEYLRLSLLSRKNDAKEKGRVKTEIKLLIEEPLEAEIIAEGIVKNKPELVKSLQKLIAKSPEKIKNLIISIPSDNVYFRTFSFPKTVSEIKIEEAMKLTIGFQLPAKPEDSYLDWEKLESPDQNEILLAVAPRNVIDAYLESLSSAGLNPVAVELHPLSLIRAVESIDNNPFLLKIPSKDGVEVFIVKNKTLKFGRILPKNSIVDKKTLGEELRRIADYFETENSLPAKFLEIDDLKIINALSADPLIKDNKWLISVGAGLRGIIPRSQDTLISLMPLGTEQAYEYQKAVSFSEFISNMIIGLSIFFAVAYLGTWSLMFTIQQKISSQVENLSNIPLPQDAVEMEEKANNLNNLMNTGYEIAKILPSYNVILEELRSKIGPEIRIANITINAPEEPINVVGTAQNRPQLNAFKKSLEASEFFTEVKIPITNIEQKENIPFSISLRVKEPQKIYPQ